MLKRNMWMVGLGCLLLLLSRVEAQGFEDLVSKYTSENGQKFMQPLGDVFGANLNSGWYHGAHISAIGLHVELGVKGMVALIGEKQKTFTAETDPGFYPPTEVEVPTVFGKREIVEVQGKNQSTGLPSGAVCAFPGGMNAKMIPIAVPQVTVGGILGTEVSIRWLAYNLNEDFGRLSMTGVGIRHSISQYIPLCPVDLAVGGFMQNFKMGDIVEAKTLAFGAQGSKSFSVLTLYGGIGYENSSLKIHYEDDDGETVNFDLTGSNKVRMTVGAALRLAVLTLHADYNISNQNVLVVGIGLGN